MTDVLVEFDSALPEENGNTWTARACARQRADGLWEGWLEFTPRGQDGEPVRTDAETRQSNRDALLYWAEGLTQVYLEGALVRALKPLRSPAPQPEASHEQTNLED